MIQQEDFFKPYSYYKGKAQLLKLKIYISIKISFQDSIQNWKIHPKFDRNKMRSQKYEGIIHF